MMVVIATSSRLDGRSSRRVGLLFLPHKRQRDYRLTILGPGGQLLAQLSTPTSHWKRFFERRVTSDVRLVGDRRRRDA